MKNWNRKNTEANQLQDRLQIAGLLKSIGRPLGIMLGVWLFAIQAEAQLVPDADGKTLVGDEKNIKLIRPTKVNGVPQEGGNLIFKAQDSPGSQYIRFEETFNNANTDSYIQLKFFGDHADLTAPDWLTFESNKVGNIMRMSATLGKVQFHQDVEFLAGLNFNGGLNLQNDSRSSINLKAQDVSMDQGISFQSPNGAYYYWNIYRKGDGTSGRSNLVIAGSSGGEPNIADLPPVATFRHDGTTILKDIEATGNITITENGSFVGDGSGLTNIPADQITGLDTYLDGQTGIPDNIFLGGYQDNTALWAGFGNNTLDHSNGENYAILQHNNGTTYLNTGAGQNLHIRSGNTGPATGGGDIMIINEDETSIYNGLTVEGSEGPGQAVKIDNKEVKFMGSGVGHYSLRANKTPEYFTIENTSSNPHMDNNGTVLMAIHKYGNVGIGTSTPTEKLEVAGNVKANAFEGDGSSITGLTTDQISDLDSHIDGRIGTSGPWNAAHGWLTYEGGDVRINQTDSRTALTIQAASNAQDQGVAFRNSGGAYSWNIFRDAESNSVSDLVISGAFSEADINNLSEIARFKNNGTTILQDLEASTLKGDGTNITDIQTSNIPGLDTYIDDRVGSSSDIPDNMWTGNIFNPNFIALAHENVANVNDNTYENSYAIAQRNDGWTKLNAAPDNRISLRVGNISTMDIRNNEIVGYKVFDARGGFKTPHIVGYQDLKVTNGSVKVTDGNIEVFGSGKFHGNGSGLVGLRTDQITDLDTYLGTYIDNQISGVPDNIFLGGYQNDTDNWAGFGNNTLDHSAGENYALLQHNDGTTYLNTGAGKDLVIRSGNTGPATGGSNLMIINENETSIYNGVTVEGTQGPGRAVKMDDAEIKFMGSGIANYSLRANKTPDYFTIENTSSNGQMDNVGTPLMAIHKFGNIGIGTTAPTAKLQVEGVNSNQLDKTLIKVGKTNARSAITIQAEDDTARQGIAFQNANNNYTWNILKAGRASGPQSDLVFTAGAAATPEGLDRVATFGSRGQVIIGSEANNKYAANPEAYESITIPANPTTGEPEKTLDASLWVSDALITNADIVYLEPALWADHVFDEEYELLPLEEVEAYIAENNHLPNVPSEADVMANGYTAQGVNAMLLEKIEELTLYTIELNKQLKEVKSELSVLKADQ